MDERIIKLEKAIDAIIDLEEKGHPLSDDAHRLLFTLNVERSHLEKMVSYRQSADELTRKHTAFESFDALLDAKGGYAPSLDCGRDYDNQILAELYDDAQKQGGDPRRAHRF